MSTPHPCMKTELSLFDGPMAQVTMEKASWRDIHPIASLDGNGPVEFHVISSQDYLDLNDSILYVQICVEKADGTKLDAAGTNKAYLSNLTLASLFSDVSLTLNGTLVEGGSHLYPFKSMMMCLLQFDDNVKSTQLQAAGYTEDSEEERANLIAGSKTVEFMGPLYLDMFSQSKYLLSGVDVRLKLNRSKNDFVIIGGTGTSTKGQYRVVFKQAILYVRKVKVDPSVIMGHDLGLQSNNAIYPIQKSELMTYTVMQGSKSHLQDNLFRGVLPKLVVVGLVGNSSFSGDTIKDPLTFGHFDVNTIALYRDGECVPYAQPLQLDFANGNVVQGYMHMIQSLEMFNSTHSNGITLSEFQNGKTLFVFNLTPDLNALGACGQVYKTGHLRLELKFGKPLEEVINIVVFGIRDGVVEITRDRSIVNCT